MLSKFQEGIGIIWGYIRVLILIWTYAPIILKPRGVSPYDAVPGSNIYILRKNVDNFVKISRLLDWNLWIKFMLKMMMVYLKKNALDK